MLRRLAAFPVISLVILLTGCGSIDPDPPSDDRGNPIPLPQAYDSWLRFTQVTPAEALPLRPTVEISFNAYLDPSTFNSYSAVRLASGGYSYGGTTDYRMTRKTLIFRPNSALEPDLTYQVVLPTGAGLRSVTASPLHPALTLPELPAREELEDSSPPARPQVSWEAVDEIFERSCNSCHSDPQWGLIELTPDELIGRASDQVDALLLVPFQPARSYLIHKILPDYPLRRFTVQPPPWSQAQALSTEEIELIEHWIANGAPH